MQGRKKLFRTTVLQRLQTPEALDQVPRLVRPASWMGLVAIVLLLIVAGVWGVTGRVATTVHAQGVILAQGGELRAVLWLPWSETGRVSSGMEARLIPSSARVERNGYLIAAIDSVGTSPEGSRDLQRSLGPTLAAALPITAALRVEVPLGKARWSGGQEAPLTTGMLVEAEVVVEQHAPLAWILP